jgi:alpha-galactosidase
MFPAQEEIIHRIAMVNNLVLESSIKEDVGMLYQAMLLDPLTGSKLGTREIIQMTDELIIAEESWLPQFKDAISAAKERIAQAKKNGSYIATNQNFQCAAQRDMIDNPFPDPLQY